MKPKAVCVMRTDLRDTFGCKVPKGKLIAQGGHAFVGLITSGMIRQEHPSEGLAEYTLFVGVGNHTDVWLNGKFTKVVLAVDSEEEMLALYEEAKHAGLNTVLITDCGDTIFPEPTNTCIGIGPDWDVNLDKITGYLSTFK